MQLMVGGIEKEKATKSMYKRSQEDKKRMREKVHKKKACCGESSQVRYKLWSLFMFDLTIVVLEL